MYLLGYDIGSSSVKVSIVDVAKDKVLDTIHYPEREMDIMSRQKGWAEQQPEIWWQYLCVATSKIIEKTNINPEYIKGIGISYQMHGLVMVDKDYHVLRPSIIWCDSRAVSIGDQAFRYLGEEYCLENFLNSPGNFTASKLKWVKDNEPEIYNKIHKVMLPGDYINMKLTGQINTTISGLSEAVLWNFKEQRIASEVLDYYGIDDDLIPDLISTFSLAGKVTNFAARQTGLHSGIPVTYRAGDQPNNALSLNVLKKGEVAATSGTSGVVYGVFDRPIYDKQSRVNGFAHVNYEENFNNIGVLLCINGAGIKYSWMKHQVSQGGRSYDDMERMASSVPVGSERVCILPFGNGTERLFQNRNLGSHITNLELNRHSRAHLYRATLEGVAFSFVYGMEVLKEMGLSLDVIKVSNDNMFRSSIFSTTIATLLGSHIEVMDTNGSIGAAKASGVKAGLYRSVEEAMANTKAIKIFEPDDNFGSYNQAYFQWNTELKARLRNSNEHTTVLQSSFLENESLKKTLLEKNRSITSQSIKLDSYHSVMKDIERSLKGINLGADNIEVKKLINKIKRLNSSNNSNGKNVFEEHFDILNDDFIKKLKSKHPLLSYDELKMSALLKMNLSSKEIATELNLSVRGVETKRYRIRKKIGLERNLSLTKYFGYI